MSLDASTKRKSDAGDGNPRSAKRPHQEDLNVHLQSGNSSVEYWMVQWRRPQARKHKTWDGMCIMTSNSQITLNRDPLGDGILICSVSRGRGVRPGDILNIAGKEIEIDHSIPPQDFISGKCFDIGGRSDPAPQSLPSTRSLGSSTPFRPVIPKVTMKPRGSGTTTEYPAPKSAGLSVPLVDTANAPILPVAGKSEKIRHWTVQWRKPQTRKHKSWDGDGYVRQEGSKVTLFDEDGLRWVDARVASIPDSGSRKVSLHSHSSDLPTTIPGTRSTLLNSLFRPVFRPSKQYQPTHSMDLLRSGNRGKSHFRVKRLPCIEREAECRHDASAPNALVMPNPTESHQKKFNRKGSEIVPVVVDPIIGKNLRPHQREGVTFMYESVMGMRQHDGQGCILADEMGLGKTIQTIALIWTLLKQNPYAGCGPVVGKVLIVCPVSLLSNWRKGVFVWLGRDRIEVLLGDKDINTIKAFKNSKHQVLIIGYERLRSVIDDLRYCRPPIGLIICDEGHRLKSADSKTTKMFEVLAVPRRIILSGTPVQNNLGEFHAMADFVNHGLLDTYKMFSRVYENPILKSRAPDCTPQEFEIGSGRAEQLAEYSKSFVLRRTADILSNYLPPKNEYVVFVRPTSLQLGMFAKILNPDKLDDLIGASTAKSLALIGRLKQLCNSPVLLRSTSDEKEEIQSTANAAIKNALGLLPESAQMDDMTLSGKMTALQSLLRILRRDTDEKVVIVSHYTATLNVIEKFCARKMYTYFRLDGSTKVDNRQMFVDKFNKATQADRFIFLLSAKAGGVGLNLIGASRLILVDSDWNPSHDLQAMARIHRDGQKRPVFIYRLLTCGTIDEKIFQRAITKIGLSESLMGQSGSRGDGIKPSKGDSFSQSELRDLFTIHPLTACHTHELLDCHCVSGTVDGTEPEFTPAGNASDASEDDEIEDVDDADNASLGFVPASQYRARKVRKSLDERNAALMALDEWTHVNCLNPAASEYLHDKALLKLIPSRQGQHSTAMDVDSEGKYSGSLLDAIDLSKIPDTDGGTVAFIFEKISKSDVT
ncbi:hypothetical protein BS47DRAFT_1293769 [Hydnum rufescens UP504]|uniref:Uncharacterized protein n=1 Tax=Hydnum rufescens UP504 TaxID=1448309 RepID=A0A9P6B0P1_9AGAM|nr:hypothetical protein BS47DRAFT_1293769 [Hydnum rufescens UP504]